MIQCLLISSMYEQWRKAFHMVASRGSFTHAARASLGKWHEIALKALEDPLILCDPSSLKRRALEAALARRGRSLAVAFVELAMSMAIGTNGPIAKAAAS